MTRTLALLALAGAAAAPSALAADAAIETLYQERCGSCHGKQFQGGNAQSMVDGVWQFGSADFDLDRNIRHGIAAVGMPAYNAVLSDAEVRGLIGLLREAQTRAGVERPPLPERLLARDYDLVVTDWLSSGLDAPWGIEFADERTAFITERPGRLRVVRDGALDPRPVAGTPEVLFRGQGGLLDVALDPDFASTGWVYLTYTHAIDRKNKAGDVASMTRLVRGRVVEGRWTDEQTLFEAPHETYKHTYHHYGSRIAFDPEGRVYFSIGERGHQDDAQDPRLPHGKVHRLERDGSVPADNPFADGEGGMPSVFTYGNRNPQGLATHPVTGAIWENEHGPMGGDEVNVLAAGVNYGWPVATYGLNYNGTAVSGAQRVVGTRQPVYYWAPSIAACGAAFVHGDEFPRWANHLLVGGLGHEVLVRLAVEGGRVMHQETLLRGQGRVRDVIVDPSGAIYVVLNGPDRVLRLTNGGAALRQ